MAGTRVNSDDHVVVGKIGRVTGRVAAGRTGEVVIAIRGGTEAFLAYPARNEDVLPEGTRAVIVEHFPPRTVYVTSA